MLFNGRSAWVAFGLIVCTIGTFVMGVCVGRIGGADRRQQAGFQYSSLQGEGRSTLNNEIESVRIKGSSSSLANLFVLKNDVQAIHVRALLEGVRSHPQSWSLAWLFIREWTKEAGAGEIGQIEDFSWLLEGDRADPVRLMLDTLENREYRLSAEQRFGLAVRVGRSLSAIGLENDIPSDIDAQISRLLIGNDNKTRMGLFFGTTVWEQSKRIRYLNMLVDGMKARGEFGLGTELDQYVQRELNMIFNQPAGPVVPTAEFPDRR